METILNRISKLYFTKKTNLNSKSNSQGLYQKIFNLFKDAILNNDIPLGSILPSTRAMASELKVSRSTVVKVYELLMFEGYIESFVGSGYKVKGIIADTVSPKSIIIDKCSYPDLSETGKSFLKTVTLMNSTDEVSIAFRPGLPPLDIFPVNQWKNLTNNYWRYVKSSALSYSATTGTEQLKKSLANYLNLSRKIKCDPQQIIIVAGSLQSLYIVGNVVVNPDDTVIMENPTFPNVHSIFKGLRAKIQPASVDMHGIKVSELAGNDCMNTKIIHTVPSCHYPTGVRMSLERRLELLKWANEHKSIIIENDYEHEVNNYKDFIPSLFSLDTEQRTVFLGTFNRLLHPSIRVGYMVVPYFLLDAVEALLKHSHRFVPSSIQVVLSQFIEKYYLYNHIKNVIEIAEERKKIFFDTFENCFGDSLTLSNCSTHSLHTLVELPAHIKDSELSALFAKNNIITHAYSKCFVDHNTKQGLIMGFTPVKTPIIKQKISQMEKLYRKYPI